MAKIDYSTIPWELFEELCYALWFDEGYTNIQPYGGYRDGGRDALSSDATGEELVIFQFKRWTIDQPLSRFKSSVEEEVKKVTKFNPRRYILNTTLEPLAARSDWVTHKLQPDYPFRIEYHDRSWLDLRLNNHRQDLRRRYFGVELERHTRLSLLATCREQISQALKTVGQQYRGEL
jgi:hypothetical protein